MAGMTEPHDFNHFGVVRMMRLWLARLSALRAPIWTNEQSASNSGSGCHPSYIVRFVLDSIFTVSLTQSQSISVTPFGCVLALAFLGLLRLHSSSPFSVVGVDVFLVFPAILVVVLSNLFLVCDAAFSRTSNHLVSVAQIFRAVVRLLFFRITVWHGPTLSVEGAI